MVLLLWSLYSHRKHQDANEARKLTKEQKRTKKLKKLKDDMASGIGVQVYRVNNLSNQSNKFKVDMNAQQYMLSGCVVLHKDINMVIVQGGRWVGLEVSGAHDVKGTLQ